MKLTGEILIRENLLGQFDIFVSYDPPGDDSEPLVTVDSRMVAQGIAEQIKYRIERGFWQDRVEFTYGE